MRAIASIIVVFATSIAYATLSGQEPSQGSESTIRRGAAVFAETCANALCHGPNGTQGQGAPRVAGRALDTAYIERVVTYGIQGTVMPAWGQRVTAQELRAVIEYVKSLNGTSGAGGAQTPRQLSGESARGRQLFAAESGGFTRCAICHQVGDVGVPVAPPITRVPADVLQLRGLAGTRVSTARAGSDTFPALQVTEIRGRTRLYDLTTVPPVLRTIPTAGLQLTNGTSWKHSDVLGRYSDGDLQTILEFLRATAVPAER